MHERERLGDFRGGMVACRGCKRLLKFPPGAMTALVCCGLLYRPEPGPIDLVIYDRMQEGEWEDALVLPAPHPTIILASDEDVQQYVVEPDPGSETTQDTEDYESAQPSDAEVEAMAATQKEIAERWEERQESLRKRYASGSRRGPSYD